MKAILILVLGVIGFGFVCQTPKQSNPEWMVTSSSIKFKIKNAGFNVDGTFSNLDAKINFDAAKLSGNFIEASIEAGTINTGNGTRDGHLKKEEYFNTAVFQTIHMKSTLFGKESDGTFRGYFKLTIKGITKDVFVPFKYKENKELATFKGDLTINRLDFGVGESSMILSNTVLLTIEVTAKRK